MSFLSFLFLFHPAAYGAVQDWEISDPSYVISESEQLVINQALDVLHPSLYVVNFKVGFTPYFVDVGNGELGAFNPSTYSNFSQQGDISGNVIRLDTNQYPALNVTDFDLQQGWVIDVIGDKPLVINSLTSIKIAGEIWCHGEDGQDASLIQAGQGGSGRCGGSAGGKGGDLSSPAEDGGDIDVIGGGKKGSSTAAEMNGGGGGSWNDSSSSTDGGSANNGFGVAGATAADPEFLVLRGSSGGGGGGTGLGTEPGAGGGGGGGLVVLHAVQDIIIGKSPSSTFGLIRINGGNGGDSLTTTGGAGGGGGAGSLQVFAGRNIELFNTSGTGVVISQSGLGGNNGAESGGNGGRARNWFSSFGYNDEGTGFYTPAEQAPVTPGAVEFSLAPQSAQSTSFDLENTLAQIQNVLIGPETSPTSWELAGSDDDFQSDDTGWTTNLKSLTGKRYIKVRVTLRATDVNDPENIESVRIVYQPGTKNQFDFEAAGCGRIGKSKKPPGPFLLSLLIPLLTVLFLVFRKRILL